MKSNWKRAMAVLLCLTLFLTGIQTQPEVGRAAVKEQNASAVTTENLSVKGKSGIGKLLEKEMTENEEEKAENKGYNVFSVERNENDFVVEFETLQPCTLLLAVYSEDGKEMITSSTTDVEPTDSEVEMTLENVPEYFLIRAFLIEPESYQPLCTKYESPMYTQEMQEFLAKETGDFEEDQVLNLDDSETNNFAVYDENTQVIEENQEVNILKEENEEEQKYVFENTDAKIDSLTEGDILSYEKEDGNVVIVKVQTIESDGDTTVVMGEDTSMDEVFDYVKIDGTQELADAQIEESDEEGVQYEGLEKENDKITTRAVDFEGSNSLEASVKFVDKKVGGEHANAKLNGSVKLGMSTSVKVYVSLSYQYLEMKIDYKLSNEISLSGTLNGNIQLLKRVGFSPVPGVFVEFTPSFHIEGSASVSVKFTVKACVGFSVSPQDGFKNLTSSPKYDNTEIDGSVNVFVGLSLEPSVVVISKAVAKASATATAGGVIDATLEIYNSSPSEDERHDCQNCIDGEISAKIVLGVGATFVSTLEVNYSKEYTFKISDFYYSLDSKTWGWGTCPKKTHKVTVVVKNLNGKKVQGAIVNDSYKTDENGVAVLWLKDGTHTITAAKGGAESVSKKITVSGKGKKVVVTFDTNTDAEGKEDSASNPLIGKKIKSVSVNRDNCGIVTTEGDLYTWGYNNGHKQLGTGLSQHKLPKKILSNVEEVQMNGNNFGAALTANGDLYIWGKNDSDLRDKLDYGEKPTKILENVKSFKIDDRRGTVCYALTNKGELYLWGNGGSMPYLIKDYQYGGAICKVMNDVKSADIDARNRVCCVVKNNGDLYAWGGVGSYAEPMNAILGDLGKNYDGEDITYSNTPIRKMQNVKSVKLGEKYCVALTNANELYAWGENDYGNIGNGTTDDVYEPQRIMSDIISYDIRNDYVDSYSVAAVNSKNQLFVWGQNEYGTLGFSEDVDGFYRNELIPTLLLDDIEEVNFGGMTGCAKTTSGSWYMWGEYAYTGTYEDFGGNKPCKPYKCPLKNVKTLGFFSDTIFAITNKNDLYMWGCGFWETQSSFRQEIKYEPVKINGDLSSFQMTQTEDEDEEYGNFGTYSLKKRSQKEFQLSDELDSVEANSIYNIYVAEDDEKNWLADDNLLYVNQCMSDSEGKFDLDYVIAKEIEGEAYVMVRKLDKINIGECKIEVKDITYFGNSVLVEPSVSYQGKQLVEGRDYELSGNVEVENQGTYVVNIDGIGSYTGSVPKTFTVSCSHEYGEWVVVGGGREQTCLICGDVKRETSPIAEEPTTKEPTTSIVPQPETTSKPSATKKPTAIKPYVPSSSYRSSKVKKPGKITGLTAKNTKKRKMQVSWNWKVNVSGFQIQYAQNRRFTKAKKSKTVGKWTSYKTISNLKKNKTYYVRVRAYRKSSGKKLYGKWSSVKKVKIKK